MIRARERIAFIRRTIGTDRLIGKSQKREDRRK